MYTPNPFKEHFLPEQDGHTVYFAEYGNPEGEVIISIHGGPGSQAKAKHAGRFNLDTYRVVLVDQRGCGKSECTDLLHENTTQKLASDMERIRTTLDIESWFVTGSSWGSTLALFYCQHYSERVKGLLLSAIFLGDQISVDWFSGPAGVSMLYTDVWEHRNQIFEASGLSIDSSAKETNDKLHSLSDDKQRQLAAGIMNWEGNLMSSGADVSYIDAADVTEKHINAVKIFMHYESNAFFMQPNQLLNDMTTISHIPLVIVHGRHDILCPFKRAWDLHKKHGNCEIIALPQSNHSFSADGAIAKRYIFENFLSKQAK